MNEPADKNDKVGRIDERAETAISIGRRIWQRPGVAGSVLGMLAAVAYTAANLGLRNVARGGDFDWAIFVSASKAIPVAMVAWLLVIWRTSRGLPGLPPKHLILPLIGTGFLMQFGGNVMFQFALSRGGLALSVPLTFSTIIVTGALLGRAVLGEPLSSRMILAMGTMMAAVAVLSRGAGVASASLVANPDWTQTMLAVVSACLSGFGYGAGGVMIRRCVTNNLSYSATIVCIASVGVFVLGPIGIARVGWETISQLPREIWLSIFGAGVANAVAFFSVNAALKHLSVVRVNLINASQIAMAAVAGVLFFAEPNTSWLWLGTLLTLAGLLLSARKDAPVRDSSEQDMSERAATASRATAEGAPVLATANDHVD